MFAFCKLTINSILFNLVILNNEMGVYYMLNNLLSKLFKLSLIISLLPICMSYTMESAKVDEGKSEHQGLNDSVDPDFNLLEQIPPELLCGIISFLPLNDSGYQFLSKYYQILYKVLPKELAEENMRKLWAKLVLISDNVQELEQRVSDKHKYLDRLFLNYNVLNQAFINIIVPEQSELLQACDDLVLVLKSDLEQENWAKFAGDLERAVGTIKRNLDLSAEGAIIRLKTIGLIMEDAKSQMVLKVAQHIGIKTITAHTLVPLFFAISFLFNFWLLEMNMSLVSAGILLITSVAMVTKNYVDEPVWKYTLSKIDLILKFINEKINEIQDQEIVEIGN